MIQYVAVRLQRTSVPFFCLCYLCIFVGMEQVYTLCWF